MTTGTARDETRAGLVSGLAAYGLWGLMPVYFLLMRPAGSVEIVGWRILFSLVFCAVLLTVLRSWGSLVAVLHDRRTTLLLGLAGVLIYVNWSVYVYASTTGQVIDAALGYFINPIVTVLLGVLVLHERLRRMQWAAVGVSVLAVVVLVVETGRLPWISLALAGSFGFYGLVKKRVGRRADVVSGLAVETAWLTPVAVVQLVAVGSTAGLAFGSAGAFTTLMLASAGIGTAVPLLLFAAAAKRLPLSVAGFLQYLGPILQFALGIAVLHEPMSTGRWSGFALVWLALVLLVGDSVVRGLGAAGRRRAAVRAA